MEQQQQTNEISYQEICAIIGNLVLDSRRIEKDFQLRYHKREQEYNIEINQLKQEINGLKNEKQKASSS